ncbi:hypothetical protein JXA32_17620 [Candidatus Sumerlaeota bacterium]|nr:hypothetical protein [Candidatus Sumerlaeota bacterium]
MYSIGVIILYAICLAGLTLLSCLVSWRLLLRLIRNVRFHSIEEALRDHAAGVATAMQPLQLKRLQVQLPHHFLESHAPHHLRDMDWHHHAVGNWIIKQPRHHNSH